MPSGNVAPHGIGTGVSQSNFGGTFSPALDVGQYMLSCELDDNALASPSAAPGLQVTDVNGNVIMTIDRPGQYPLTQPIRPYSAMTVTNTGNTIWRRVSINLVQLESRSALTGA